MLKANNVHYHFSFYSWLSTCSRLLLLSHLQHFPVGIRVQFSAKSWAICRAVFRYKSARLIPNPTCITKCFRTIGTCPPLWSTFGSTVMTFSPNGWDLHPLVFGNFVTRLSPRKLLIGGFSNANARPTSRLAPCTDRELHVIIAT